MKVRLRVPAVDDPDLTAELSHGETAVLRLVGSADSAATQPLGELLDEIHHELVARETPELVIDLRALDHLAATCLRQLVAWFGRREGGAGYRIRIRIQPALSWQQSLRALACFDTQTISIET